MATTKIKDINGYDEFRTICEFFKCEDEYPGWTGVERYIIITDFSEDELNNRFPEILSYMKPYLIANKSYGEIRRDANNAERRAQRLSAKYESNFSFDDETEMCHEELVDYGEVEHLQLSLEMEAALSLLTEVQKQRVIKYFFEGLTLEQIAVQECVDRKAVSNSINYAKKKLRDFFA